MLQVNHSDLDRVKEAILPWLQSKLPETEIIDLPPLYAPGGGGSSQTLFLSPVLVQRGEQRQQHWVLRVQATDHQVYQDPSVERQYLVMRELANLGTVPMPQMLWYEADPQILGAPFFLMERIDGEVPQAFYHSQGIFPEVIAADREQMWLSAVESLSSIHLTNTESFQFLAHPDLGETGLDQEIAIWDAYSQWNAVPLTVVQEKTRQWLSDNLPAKRPTGLAWGDARLPNMVFRDKCCQAVIDWETVSLAGAETDLGWWLFFDWYMTDGSGMLRLPGIPGPQTFIATWESYVGRKAQNMEWHEVFATWRYSMIRDRALMLFGQERPDDFEQTDPALQRLARLIST